MLTWREDGVFIAGDSGEEVYAAAFHKVDKRLIGVSHKLTPEEFRQVADKLEELQGKKEETGKRLRLEKRRRGEEVIHVVYDIEGKRLGHFAPVNLIGLDVFTQDTGRELTSFEKAQISQFSKQLNFRL